MAVDKKAEWEGLNDIIKKKKKEWETYERNHHPFLLALRNSLPGTFCPT